MLESVQTYREKTALKMPTAAASFSWLGDKNTCCEVDDHYNLNEDKLESI